MMSIAAQISGRLQTLTPTVLDVHDDSHLHVGHAEAGNGAHLRLHIVSTHFTNMSPIARHRLVYQTLGNLVGSEIHALSISAQTPLEATVAKE